MANFTLIWGLILSLMGCQLAPQKKSVTRVGHIDQQVVFSLITLEKLDSKENLTAALEPYSHMMESARFVSSRKEGGMHVTMVDAFLKEGFQAEKVVETLEKDQKIGFASLNYVYEGEAFDEAYLDAGDIKDPSLERQHHHIVMQNKEAWKISMGEGIVVAVTDMGVDTAHEDLVENLWKNIGELGLDDDGNLKMTNGVDDDENGYIDDYQGWDTTSQDGSNDPSTSHSHGTHIAGIIAASINDIGIVGTAPKAAVLPIKFAGQGVWNSLDVARAYTYASVNGAKIINTSFRIDQYVDDKVYLNAIKDTYMAGVLIFNSAGNAGMKNPQRQAFEHILLVANTVSDGADYDTKSPSSNYGWGIDISAPGTRILSTVAQGRYAAMSGTSMAAPNAAAAAALIWSKNPEWTKEQVVAMLFSGALDIDERNKKYAGQLGSGRVDSLASLIEDLPAPRVAGLLVSELNRRSKKIILTLDSVLDPESVDISKISLFEIVDGEEIQIPLTLVKPYALGSNRLIFELQNENILGTGTFKFVLDKSVLDPFGQGLDGDSSGDGPSDYIETFEI